MMRINKELFFSIVLALIVLLGGCKSNEETQQANPDERMKHVEEAFAEGNYLSAIEDLKVLTLQFQGSAFADRAQFLMAECRFLREEYITAAYEYELLIITMPSSPYVPRARFRRAMCYYYLSPSSNLDQEYSRKAIDEFQAFIEYHPTDSLVTDAERRIVELNMKIAEKEYKIGLHYLTLNYYRAAIVSFDYVLEKYHDTPFAEQARFKKAEAIYYRKKYVEAKAAFEQFLQKFPNSQLRKVAEEFISEINRKIAQSSSEVPSEKKP